MKKEKILLVDSQLVDMWNDLVILISATEKEVVRNSGGSVNAGIKLRVMLNSMKKKITEIKKRSINVDKQRKFKRIEAKYKLKENNE